MNKILLALLKLKISFSAAGDSGFTLVEFLVAIAILSLVLFPIYEFLRQGALSWEIGENNTQVVQNARIGIEYVTDELRGAKQLYTINSTQIRFWYKDSNSDALAGPDEIITYSWSGAPDDNLNRKLDSESVASPLANYVENFNLEYWDAAGVPTINPNTVKIINVSLKTSKLAKTHKYETILRSSIYLRNL